MMILIIITIIIRMINNFVKKSMYNIQAVTITFVIVKYKLDEPILDTPRIILFITPQLQKGPKDFLQKAEVTSNQACHLYE